MTERRSSATSWLAGMVVLATAGTLFIAFRPRPEPDRVTVKQILISFQGATTKAKRSQTAAGKLAQETFRQAWEGEDFDALMNVLSDDPSDGIYSMYNKGVTADSSANDSARVSMLPAFGDLCFKLRVGEIRMLSYDPNASPYGWHIIKRVK